MATATASRSASTLLRSRRRIAQGENCSTLDQADHQPHPGLQPLHIRIGIVGQ